MLATPSKTAMLAALAIAAVALTGCVVRPGPHDHRGGTYYAEQRPVYVTPGYRAAPRWDNSWQRKRWYKHKHKHHRDWDDD